MNRLIRLAVAPVLLAIALLWPAAGQASNPIEAFSVESTSTQAGAHSDLIIENRIGADTSQAAPGCGCTNLKDLFANLPPGFVGAPKGLPQCTASEFANWSCPSDTQIGVTAVTFGDGQDGQYWIQPLYNMVPRAGQLALLATFTPLVSIPSIFTSVTVRTESDYGLEFNTFGIPQLVTPNEIDLITWGVPADPSHDVLRWPQLGFEGFYLYTIGCDQQMGSPLPQLIASEFPRDKCAGYNFQAQELLLLDDPPTPANSPAVPFVSNPTTCGVPLTATLQTNSYDRGTDRAETAVSSIDYCDQLSFNPSLAAKPTTTEADSPSGLDVDLTVPQTLSPSTPAPSAIRGVKVELPAGFAVNSNAADGKSACTAAQARFGTREAAQCPEYAKIGTLGVISSSFPGVLPGAMYLGEPLPGERYRVFLVFDGFSLHVKLPGTAMPDPVTGQLTISFDDLPQFNFSEFDMHVFGAERGLLVTPERCGTYPVKSTFTPWAHPALPRQTSTQFFRIDSGPGGSPCPGQIRPFEPSFSAGVSDSTGGAHSTFSVLFNRLDGDQSLTGLNVQTPPGFSAVLKGIPYCPEAAIAQLSTSAYTGLSELALSSCPAASQIGTVVAGAGAGSRPLSIDGRVYLAGPYKGAPLSLVVVVPAVSGPYDLGNIAVRVALEVDPLTAQVSAVSDYLPQILEGIPLRTRSIRVNLDRKNFVLNPTNCQPSAVTATVFGNEGGVAGRSSHFQVANCADLAYEPKLSLRLSGGLRRLGHPAIHAVLRSSHGEASSRRISVTLPKGELLDNSHIRNICTRVNFARNACPGGSQIGRVEVTSPILDNPLRGAVYLRSSSNELPDIALDLEGQFDIEAAGRIDSVKGRLRTTFEAIPDVPVSRIALDLTGGAKGLLQNSGTLCGARKSAIARMVGQNGRRANSRVELQVLCGKARRR